MARRMREVTGFRGGFRDVAPILAPILARSLIPGPAGLVAGALLAKRQNPGRTQGRPRDRDLPPARPPSAAPVQAIIKVEPAKSVAPTRSAATRSATTPVEDWLDHSPEAKSIAGDLVRRGAIIPGFARGGWHTFEDLVGGAVAGVKLLNAPDSGTWQAAKDGLARVADASAAAGREALENPSAAIARAEAGLQNWGEDLAVKTLPWKTPVEDTFRGEIDRQVNIGLNQGELLFDTASLFAGGAAIKGLSGAGKAAKGMKTVEHYVARGVPYSTAQYFVQPYKGMGHHYLPRRIRLPESLGGGPIPPAISDSPFFLLKPKGIQMGDFYELHYRVDPHFNGGRVPRRFGNVAGWSGKTLGWEKEDALGRIWYGAPDPLKYTAGGALGTGVIGLGAWVDEHDDEEKRR